MFVQIGKDSGKGKKTKRHRQNKCIQNASRSAFGVSKCMAPVLPFICEKIYQGLIEEKNQSIHYCNYPRKREFN
ncbi:MAG: hypothetical protein Ct9H90mP22_2180 [Gammaproteobacteria bacterium]|nr:MAG: hypothetical protein Ct9H90mP22_2180 [Gammaproteobacteria bacterium]